MRLLTDHAVRRVVIVLAKAPVPGRVKTRLAPPATPHAAAEVAAAALLDTLDAARGVVGAAVVVALAGDLRDAVRAPDIEEALAGAYVVGQGDGSLGARIATVHHEVARRFPAAVSLLIGMDTPQVDAALLSDALDLVGGVEEDSGGPAGALGLAVDGGWWALALRDPRWASVVAAVPTSRPDTGRRTLDALRAGSPGRGPQRVRELPVLADVDTAADAGVVADLVPGSRFAHAVREFLPLVGGHAR